MQDALALERREAHARALEVQPSIEKLCRNDIGIRQEPGIFHKRRYAHLWLGSWCITLKLLGTSCIT